MYIVDSKLGGRILKIPVGKYEVSVCFEKYSGLREEFSKADARIFYRDVDLTKKILHVDYEYSIESLTDLLKVVSKVESYRAIKESENGNED
jgi:hypothetical protein